LQCSEQKGSWGQFELSLILALSPARAIFPPLRELRMKALLAFAFAASALVMTARFLKNGIATFIFGKPQWITWNIAHAQIPAAYWAVVLATLILAGLEATAGFAILK
jgi:hypothetical protein